MLRPRSCCPRQDPPAAGGFNSPAFGGGEALYCPLVWAILCHRNCPPQCPQGGAGDKLWGVPTAWLRVAAPPSPKQYCQGAPPALGWGSPWGGAQGWGVTIWAPPQANTGQGKCSNKELKLEAVRGWGGSVFAGGGRQGGPPNLPPTRFQHCESPYTGSILYREGSPQNLPPASGGGEVL